MTFQMIFNTVFKVLVHVQYSKHITLLSTYHWSSRMKYTILQSGGDNRLCGRGGGVGTAGAGGVAGTAGAAAWSGAPGTSGAAVGAGSSEAAAVEGIVAVVVLVSRCSSFLLFIIAL